MAFIIGDIRWCLPSKPETGWGILLSSIFIGPPLLVFGLFLTLRIRRLRKDDQKIGPTIKTAVVIAAALLVVTGAYSFGMGKYEDYVNRDKKAQAQMQAELDRNETISIDRVTEPLTIGSSKAFYYGNVIKADAIKSDL